MSISTTAAHGSCLSPIQASPAALQDEGKCRLRKVSDLRALLDATASEPLLIDEELEVETPSLEEAFASYPYPVEGKSESSWPASPKTDR
ncbi:hypothetical protein [Bordetella flabilis]|uniref:hypothetical protein n=1 Tax=Bordetella flabilis TaxID=463014 RepID=UPI000AA290A0|nr:hypothetical protein [Bordetella flabilis]